MVFNKAQKTALQNIVPLLKFRPLGPIYSLQQLQFLKPSVPSFNLEVALRLGWGDQVGSRKLGGRGHTFPGLLWGGSQTSPT